MNVQKNHDKILKDLGKEYKELLEASPQAVYLYMDDHHILWNKKFGEMVGYKTPALAHKTKRTFVDLFVDAKSQRTLVNAYMKAMNDAKGSSNTIVWKNKNGKTKKSNTILVPIPFKGHVMALHFIE